MSDKNQVGSSFCKAVHNDSGDHLMTSQLRAAIRLAAWCGLAFTGGQSQQIEAAPIVYQVDLGRGPTNQSKSDFDGDLRVIGTITADPELDAPFLTSDLALYLDGDPLGGWPFTSSLPPQPSQSTNGWSASSTELRFGGEGELVTGWGNAFLFTRWGVALSSSSPHVQIWYGLNDVGNIDVDPDDNLPGATPAVPEDNIGSPLSNDLQLFYPTDDGAGGFLVGRAIPEPSAGVIAFSLLPGLFASRLRRRSASHGAIAARNRSRN